MCIKVIFSIRRIGNMYLRYFLSWLFSGGRASFFIFFWLHTLLYHIPFAKKRLSCFCPQRGISARFPACLLLPIAAGTDTCRMLCAKPAVELPVMTLHAELFGPPLAPFCRFNVKRVWLACRLHAGTTGRICLLAPCGHVLPKPVASCSIFHYCFWPKSQSFSAAKIVCGRERLDKP